MTPFARAFFHKASEDCHQSAGEANARPSSAESTWYSLLPLGLVLGIWVLVGPCAASSAPAAEALSLNWTNNLLTISGPNLFGEKVEVWYLEAFCHRDSTRRDWGKTTLPHKTHLISAEPHHLSLLTTIAPGVEMRHEISSSADEVEFEFEIKNRGGHPVDLEWFEPACIRVDRFTGLNQSNYISRSFIYTSQGLTTMDHTRRREEALYRGGQVYVPKGVNLDDVNPRPISPDQPVNGLIGCFSADGKQLLATASDSTHELFQGVYVCLHSDPHVGGLAAGETKKVKAKIYFLKNDPVELLKRYQTDFVGH